MKLIIKINQKEIFNRFIIYLPTALIKSKLFWSFAFKNQKDSDNQIIIVKKVYKELKKYIREYGHFNLIEVKTKDVDVLIKI